MLTAARAWVGPPHLLRHGTLGGCDHLPGHHRRLLGEESGGSPKSLHHRQLMVPRLGLEGAAPAPAPAPPSKAICGEGLDGEAGMWIRYSRKRKKQERRSPKAEEEDGSGSGVTEVKAGEGEQICSAMDSSPRSTVCADCGTSRTPLWRKGPAGPKSLCNACGIRYRKAKRAGGPFPDAPLLPVVVGKGAIPVRGPTYLSPPSWPRRRPGQRKRASAASRGHVRGRIGGRRSSCGCWRRAGSSSRPAGRRRWRRAVLLMAMSSGLFVPSC